jgi:cell division protease FtsH
LDQSAKPTFLPAADTYSAGTYSEQTAQEIDSEVRRLIDEQGQRVRTLLAALHPVLLSGAKQLLTAEVMTGEELKALLPPKEEESMLQ